MGELSGCKKKSGTGWLQLRVQDDGLTQNHLLVQTHLHSLELNISFKQAGDHIRFIKGEAAGSWWSHACAQYEKQKKGQAIWAETELRSSSNSSNKHFKEQSPVVHVLDEPTGGTALSPASQNAALIKGWVSSFWLKDRASVSIFWRSCTDLNINVSINKKMCSSLSVPVVSRGLDGSHHSSLGFFKISTQKARGAAFLQD